MTTMPVADDKRRRYLQVQGDRGYRLALRKIAADRGMTISAYLESLVKSDRPEIELLAAQFERAARERNA